MDIAVVCLWPNRQVFSNDVFFVAHGEIFVCMDLIENIAILPDDDRAG